VLLAYVGPGTELDHAGLATVLIGLAVAAVVWSGVLFALARALARAFRTRAPR
jgi:hypothetical protein